MFEHLQRLAFDVHSALKERQISISRAQVHEGLAAVLGYGSVAAMKVDPDFEELESCFALVLDKALAMRRFVGFGLAPQEAELIVQGVPSRLNQLIKGAIGQRRLPRELEAHVCLDDDDFLAAFDDYAQIVVFESDEVADEMANTNATFDDVDVDSSDLSVDDVVSLLAGAQFYAHARGVMSGDQIDEKMWTDNDIEFSITSTFEKVGKVGVRHLSNEIAASQVLSDQTDE